LRHKDQSVVSDAARAMMLQLKQVFGERVLGPISPSISRIQNMFIQQILLKIENDASALKAKSLIKQVSDNIQNMPKFKSLWVNFDVDPL